MSDTGRSQAPSHRARVLWVVGLLVLCALAAWQRTSSTAEWVDRPDGSIHLLGGDSYFHLRHTRFSLEHFPAVQRADIATHYPTGTRSVAGLFDVLMAALALPLHGADASDQELMAVVAWTPVLLAVLTLVVLAFTVTRLARPALGLLAVLLFVLFPGENLLRSAYGFADHHVLEVLLWVATTWGLVRCLELERRAPGTRGLRPDVVSAAPLAIFLFSWLGAPLHVANVCIALSLVALLAVARDRDAEWIGPAIARYGLSVLLLAVPPALVWPWLPIERRVLTMGLLALLVLGTAVPLLVRVARGRPAQVRFGLVAGSLVGVFVVLGLAYRLSRAFRVNVDAQIGRKGPTIAEHFTIDASNQLTAHGVLLPLCVVGVPWLCLRLARRGGRDWTALVAVLHGIAFYVLAYIQSDYRYVTIAALALTATLVVGELLPLLSARARQGLAMAGALAVLLPFWPLGWAEPPVLAHDRVERTYLFNDGWFQAADWLARETPPPPLPTTTRLPTDQPRQSYIDRVAKTYGVATTWDDGHFVAALARRSVLHSGYPSRRLARVWMIDDEEVAHRTLREWGPDVRYVVSEPRTVALRFSSKVQQAGLDPGRYLAHADITDDGIKQRATTFGKRHDATLVSRLYQRSGMGLGRFRLVYETPHETLVQYYTEKPKDRGGNWGVEGVTIPIESAEQRARYAPLVGRADRFGDGYSLAAWIEPTVKVFELVEGAIVEGAVEPGATVVLELELESNARGRRHRYLRTGVADAQGRFAIRVAYGSREDTEAGRHPSEVRPRGPYRLHVQRGGQLTTLARFDLAQSVVHAGRQLDLGVLSSATPPSHAARAGASGAP
ncbi:MAG: hypothetical protein OXT09_32290 [Myxococcales bacterium]|nr:hypothetical protein [Myxococcales bacterium]